MERSTSARSIEVDVEKRKLPELCTVNLDTAVDLKLIVALVFDGNYSMKLINKFTLSGK